MNKKILAVAVVAAMSASTAVMADATVYGKAHISVDNFDRENAAQVSGWDMTSRGSKLGVKGSEDLGDGLKAIYKMEFHIAMVDGDGDINNGDTGAIKMRNSYIGLKGDFGTFVVGRHDTPYKMSTGKLEQFGDRPGDYNDIGFSDVRADNAIAYISPSMSGLTLAGAIVPAGGATVDGTGNVNADDLSEAFSAAAMYSNGPFYAALAYETLSDDVTGTNNVAAADDNQKWRAGVGYSMDAFKVGFLYESQNPAGTASDADLWVLNGSYTFGNNTLKAQYQAKDFDTAGTADPSQWTIGLDHKMSKRTMAYAQYSDYDDDDAAATNGWSAFSVGMSHSF